MRLAAAAATVLFAIVLATPARALVVADQIDRDGRFAAPGCGAESTVGFQTPRGAFRLRVLAPKLGAVFTDDVTDAPVARLRAIEISRNQASPAIRFSAVGSDDACARPQQYAGRGWAVSDVSFNVGYRINLPVYFDSYNARGRTGALIRPHSIRFGKRSLIYRVRWRRWNGRIARGRGRTDGRRVAVTLSGPRYCGFRLVYKKLAFTYLGRKPPGARKRYTQPFFCR